jgi:hypothetical protein
MKIFFLPKDTIASASSVACEGKKNKARAISGW